MTCNKRAFSLLEIMVVLVILLIIGVVAYPVMNNYLVQSKVADAITAASPLQAAVTNKIASNGTVTGSGENLNTPTTISRYVTAYNIEADGTIDLNTSPDAGGIHIYLTPVYDSTSEQVSWTCSVDNENVNSMVPSQCRV